MRRLFAILAAGILAGALNLVAAAAIFGGGPMHGFQMIASGLLGEPAFGGGLPAAILGALLHFAISIVAAALYLWATLRNRALGKHWLLGGVSFGIVTYLVMHFVVVPLSYAAGPPASLSLVIKEILAHTLMFGIPIARAVRVLSRNN